MISNSDYTQDYTQEYQLAEAAYLQGNYEKAAAIIDSLVTKFHDDPSVRLLRGHIYCYGLYQYEIGKKEYEYVLTISTDPEFLQFANSGLEYANSCLSQAVDRIDKQQFGSGDSGGHYRETTSDPAELLTWRQPEDLTADEDFDLAALSFNVDMSGQLFPSQATDFFSESSTASGHQQQARVNVATGFHNNEQETLTDAFAFGYTQTEGEPTGSPDTGLLQTFSAEEKTAVGDDTGFFNISPAAHRAFASFDPDRGNSPGADPASPQPQPQVADLDPADRPTMIFSSSMDNNAFSDTDRPNSGFSVADISDALNEISGALPQAWPPTNQSAEQMNWMNNDVVINAKNASTFDDNHADATNDFMNFGGPSTFNDEFAAQANSLQSPVNLSPAADSGGGTQSGFFDLPDNFLAPPDRSAMDGPKSSAMFDDSSTFINGVSISGIKMPQSSMDSAIYRDDNTHMNNNEKSLGGILAPFENASFQKKQWLISGAAGIGAAVAIAGVTFGCSLTLEGKDKTARDPLQRAGLIMMVVGGLTSFGITRILTGRYTKQVTRSVRDLQSNFEQVSQGNMSARATVSSQDELGTLSSSFNYMLQSVVTSNSEAQRKPATWN